MGHKGRIIRLVPLYILIYDIQYSDGGSLLGRVAADCVSNSCVSGSPSNDGIYLLIVCRNLIDS
jgi:hypothetical protein